LHSQTGPAGVETSTDNVLWLKADQGTFNNAGTTPSTAGGAIQQWNDQSGNGINVTCYSFNGWIYNLRWLTNAMNGMPAVQI
jgi:hypothetical protein